MNDLSIMIKIGGQLEKSFGDAIRGAQSGLSGLNAAVSKEMAEAGNISSAAAMEMQAAGKMFSGASREMGSAGRTGASAFRELASGGRAAAASSSGMTDAGRDTASAFREMAAEGGKAAGAVRDIASTGKVTSSSVRDIASAVKGAVTGFKDMSTQAGKASKDLQMAGGEVTSLSTDLATSGKGIFNLSKDLGKAGELAGAASKGFLIAGAAIASTVAVAATAAKVMKEVAEYSIQVGKEFEASMSDAAATADASAEDFGKMEQAAMEMGRTTSKTASESANALEYMALAGWDVDTSISALPSVLKMSEASGMELGRTSDLVTDSMAALGVTVDQLPGYLDVAAKAQTKSNQSTEQLMEAYIGVGGTMKNLGIPITESATALGVLANRGIKGSEAGNALNAVMVNLTTGTGQAGKMIQSLGVSAFDQQGKFIGLEETLQQLNTSLQGCSEEQRNAALAAIGGKQHIDALNSLMAGLNTTNEEGISEWAALTNELENCNGSLQKMRDMKLDNLEGDLKTLESATQDAGIKIYKHLNTPLRDFTQFGTRAVSDASAALEAGGFSEMAMSVGSSFADGLGMVVERLPEFLAKAAVGTVSFLVGFITELPASLLKGIIKGVPRLIKALPGIGVDIVKAIIKGILSMGSAPLKAIVGLFLDGKDNAEDMEKAGADAVTGDTADTKEEMAATAIPSAPPQKIGIKGTDMMGTALPVKQKGMLLEGQAGQSGDTPDIGTDAAVIAEPELIDQKPLGIAARQMPAGFSVDTSQPAEGTDVIGTAPPIVADVAPTSQELKAFEPEVPGETGAEAQAGGSIFAGIPMEGMQVPGGQIEAQSSVSSTGISAEPLTIDVDMAGMAGGVERLPGDTVPGTAPAPSEAMLEMPAEFARAFPDGDMQDMSVGTTQVTAEAASDMEPGNSPVFAGAIQMPPGIGYDMGQAGDSAEIKGISDITPDAAVVEMKGVDGRAAGGMSAQDIAVSVSDNIGNTQTPSMGIGAASISGITAQAEDFLRAGAIESAHVQSISAPGINMDHIVLPNKERIAGSLDGIGKGLGSIIDAPREGDDIAEINANGVPQMPQFPAQKVAEALPGAAVPGATAIQGMPRSTDNARGVLSVMESPKTMTDGQEQAVGTGIVSGWIRSITNMRQTAAGIPDTDTVHKPSMIDEILDMLSKKRGDQDGSASDASPSFTLNLTINVEGSGSVEKDVEKGVQAGMREFDKKMRQWLKQNKRTAFV